MRSALVVAVLAPLVACSKKSEGPAPEAKPAAGSAAPATGSAAGSAGSAAGSAGTAAGSAAAGSAAADAKFCFARVEDTYYDIGGVGSDEGKQPPEAAKAAAPLEVKQDKGAVTLCKGTACTPLAGLPANEETYVVAISADGKRAAVGGVPLAGF
ncbi:MAG: hypothetical protein SFX73_29275 [Kofleriaceae bacterium]|nr:hypothetical protein [Kofleriaceae bacterium]